MAQVKITVRRNGPFRVEAPEGTIELVDADGNPYDLTGKTAFSLCRCGGSVNKPFCDGTHSQIGFQAAEAAVKKIDEAAPQEPTSGVELNRHSNWDFGNDQDRWCGLFCLVSLINLACLLIRHWVSLSAWLLLRWRSARSVRASDSS